MIGHEKAAGASKAKDEGVIRRHAEISGFPVSKITEVRKMIDPTTEHGA